MAKFKVGDIVRLKDSNDKDKDYFYKVVNNNVIEGENNLGKILECEFLDNILHKYIMESQMQKVTFYEMLEYVKDRNIRLTINKPNWVILNCLIDSTEGVTKGISYTYDSFDDIVTLYYNISFIQNNLYMNFDNLNFEKDYMKYKINKELDKCVDILKDTFVNYLIYGENITKDEFLKKALEKETPKVDVKPFVPEISFYTNWKPNYIDMFNIDKTPKCIIVAGPMRTGKTKTLKEMCEDNMAKRKEKELKDKIDNVNYWYKIVKEMANKPEPKEDEVFVNNKKKTTVIKWSDGELTKATCDKGDKYDLEKGVMVAMLKRYYTVDEINSFIEKAKESQERDLKKSRKKSSKEVKKTLVDNPGEKPTNPTMGVKIKELKKKEDVDLKNLPF